MHAAVMNFLRKANKSFKPEPPFLEMGSLIINGSPRSVFKDKPYIGIDLNKGLGVDVIANAHNLPFLSNCFNTIISTEMLEHDNNPRRSISEAFRVLKPGGVLIFTAATDQRPPHEIWVTGHYRNIPRSLIETELGRYTDDWYVETSREDIRFWARKAGK